MSEDRKGPRGDEDDGDEEAVCVVEASFLLLLQLLLPLLCALLRLLLLFLEGDEEEAEGEAFVADAESIVFPLAAESLTAALFFFQGAKKRG